MKQWLKQVEASGQPVWEISRPLVHINKWFSSLETGLNFVGALLIAFIMFMTSYGVIARYAFNKPLIGKVEITELVMAGLVFFGLSYTQRLHGHVRMSLLLERVTKGRAYHLTELFTLFSSIVAFAILTVATLKCALYDLSVGGSTYLLYWPTWPSKLCVPIGGAFLCIRLTIQFTQHFLQAVVGIERRDL